MIDVEMGRSAADGNVGQGKDNTGDLTIRLSDTLRQRLEYPHHRRMLLEESAISPAVAVERGYYTARTKAELARLGFSKLQQREPALVIPMYSPSGELVT